MNTTLRPLAIAIALMNSPFALAADNAEPRELDAVTISASRSETRVEEMPLHTTVISRTEIEESPAQTLDQLLRNIPGMNFTGVPASQSDPTGHQTKMRGLGNSKVLVLLDGVPIHDPFYMTTQWFKLPLSNIERVEIVRGGNSSLWGNMAVAGVVNVVSKRVKDNAGEAVVSVGSRGTVNVAVSKNFAVSEALSFHLAADIYHTDGYQTTPSEYLWRFPTRARWSPRTATSSSPPTSSPRRICRASCAWATTCRTRTSATRTAATSSAARILPPISPKPSAPAASAPTPGPSRCASRNTTAAPATTRAAPAA
jgi:iron complex outermembrane receptor protein